MSSAVVDASPAVNFGGEPWVVQENKVEIRSHRRPAGSSAWTELRDTKDALAIARRGSSLPVLALRHLRPESLRPEPLFRWRHRPLPLAEHRRLSVEQLAQLRLQFANNGMAEKSTAEKTHWANLAGMSLVAYDNEPDEYRRRQARMHCMQTVNFLVREGLLAPDCPEQTVEDIIDLLDGYDELRLRRNKLEAELEALASKSIVHRVALLGASAVRGVYRLAVTPISWPTLRLSVVHGRLGRNTTSELRQGRRFAYRLALGLTAIGLAAFWYKAAHSHEHASLTASIHLPASPASPDSVNVPLTPTGSGAHNTMEFSLQARTISPGEGWESQLSQMHVKYSTGLMDSVGPWLKVRGYAYQALSGEWRMNLMSGQIDQDTLQQLYGKAQEYGAVT